MKKVLLFLFVITVISSSFAVFVVKISKPGFINASEVMIPIGKTGEQISLLDLSRISRHELEDLTGERMNFLGKIAFKKTQKTLKKEINPDGTIENKKINKFFSKNAIDDKTKGFHSLGFILGFFLGIIGVVIAYVRRKHATRIIPGLLRYWRTLVIRRFTMSFRTAYLVILSSTVIALVLPVCPATAQESADTQNEIEHRWLVTFSLATTSSGPANDIQKAMVASGFNQTSSGGFFGGPVAHPFSRTGFGAIGFPWMIALRYSTRSPFLLGVTVSNAPIGTTLGYRDPYLFLFINYSVFTISPTVSVQFADVLHLGIGPAIYFAKSSQDNAGTEAGSKSAAKVGLLMDVGLSIPARSLFFPIVSLQYRYVGKVAIGPFESRFINSAATMPTSSVSYNHTFIAVGMGLRL